MVQWFVLRYAVFALFLSANLDIGWTQERPNAADESVERGIASASSSEEPLEVFEMPAEVERVLQPLFRAVRGAPVTRSTIDMRVDSLNNGRVLDQRDATFQIASRAPDAFTIYLREPDRRTRLYCDGKTFRIAVAADAYFDFPNLIDLQRIALEPPVPLGPYPEPLLSLTLAGVDPAISLAAGMRTIELTDSTTFRGQVPAHHLRGEQADLVQWDLWISRDDKRPRPYRLQIDLTPMLIATGQVPAGDGFSYRIRYDFKSWRTRGEVANDLFEFRPPKTARRYESYDDYVGFLNSRSRPHPLVGQALPKLNGLIDDPNPSSPSNVHVIHLWDRQSRGCAADLETLHGLAEEYLDRNVTFHLINSGEKRSDVASFLKSESITARVRIDPAGRVAKLLKVDSLPLTLVIGPDRVVEAAYRGFISPADLRRQLIADLGGQ